MLPTTSSPFDTAEVLTPGTLTLAATPIGHPLDASVRLIRALGEADLIAAEDTRRTQRLVVALGITVRGRYLAYHEHNEVSRTEDLLAALRAGQKVVLVTDAGMPVVSDPGFRAVRAVVEAGFPIDVFPGPSAVLTALAASGLAPDRFSFEGFAPRKDGQRRSTFEAVREDTRTLIWFDSPRRTADTLAVMAEVLGASRPAVVARELTKTYQELRRGTLAELAAWASEHEVLGEIVLVVAGADAVPRQPEDLVALVLERAATGERMKDAAKAVAKNAAGVSARELYERALEQQRG